jgi:hypothetical protein
VAVARGDRILVDKKLDLERRTLQEIALPAVAGGGGDYTVEVVGIVPGSKKAWREIGVSEFEVRPGQASGGRSQFMFA